MLPKSILPYLLLPAICLTLSGCYVYPDNSPNPYYYPQISNSASATAANSNTIAPV